MERYINESSFGEIGCYEAMNKVQLMLNVTGSGCLANSIGVNSLRTMESSLTLPEPMRTLVITSGYSCFVLIRTSKYASSLTWYIFGTIKQTVSPALITDSMPLTNVSADGRTI